MATKRASSKKGGKKGAKKSSKKAARKASAKSAAFPIPKPDPACLRKCAEQYRRCRASGVSPAVCLQRFARCAAGCFKV